LVLASRKLPAKLPRKVSKQLQQFHLPVLFAVVLILETAVEDKILALVDQVADLEVILAKVLRVPIPCPTLPSQLIL
jgi:hypothetical protein